MTILLLYDADDTDSDSDSSGVEEGDSDEEVDLLPVEKEAKRVKKKEAKMK